MRVSHYEIYEASYGQWSLKARLQPRDEALARSQAEKNWTSARIPTALLQESITDDGGELEVMALYNSPGIKSGLKAPDSGGSMSGSLTTVGISGAIAGAVGAVIGSIALAGSPARFFLTLLIFLIVSAGAMLVLFRVMVPAELMMWRNKTTEAKRKAIETLSTLESAPDTRATLPPGPVRPRRQRKGAFSHPKSEQIPAEVLSDGLVAQVVDHEIPPPTQSGQLQELIGKQVIRLTSFASDMMAALNANAGKMASFDRYGINLYLAGAAQELAWRESLTGTTVKSILSTVLTEQGTAHEIAKAFCERLDVAEFRPRYKAVMEAGRIAMAATIDGQPIPQTATIETVMTAWSNPHGNAVTGTSAARRMAVLLTDLVGSTDATRKLGNSGAQRLLRAHNAIVRAALKDCKGQEIKHTGDGILAIFTSPIDAGNAAIAIQQDTHAYIRDNPDLPLAIRIGIEYGDGMKDETGEYFGPAFTTIEGICDAGGGGEIAVPPIVKEQSEGANLKYVELTPNPTAKLFVPGLFKLLWEPKRVYNAPPLEYRQLGAAPTAAPDEL